MVRKRGRYIVIDKKLFTANMAKLKAAFPSFKLDTAGMQFWYKAFMMEDETLLGAGIALYIATQEYPPTIAGIRKAMLESVTTDQLTAEQAWNTLGLFIRRHGSYANAEQLGNLDESIKEITRGMGGYRSICQSTNQETTRSQFLRLYREKVEGPKRDALNTPILSAGIAKHISSIPAEIQTEPQQKRLSYD